MVTDVYMCRRGPTYVTTYHLPVNRSQAVNRGVFSQATQERDFPYFMCFNQLKRNTHRRYLTQHG